MREKARGNVAFIHHYVQSIQNIAFYSRYKHKNKPIRTDVVLNSGHWCTPFFFPVFCFWNMNDIKENHRFVITENNFGKSKKKKWL